MKKLNYEFKLRDIAGTTARHATRIEKLKKKMKEQILVFADFLVQDELNDMSSYNLISKNPFWFDHWIKEPVKESGLSQKILKDLKTQVNAATYNLIQSELLSKDLPKSYTTAFYCLFYNRINKMMTRTTHYILENYS